MMVEDLCKNTMRILKINRILEIFETIFKDSQNLRRFQQGKTYLH